jgi:hypothetical protein
LGCGGDRGDDRDGHDGGRGCGGDHDGGRGGDHGDDLEVDGDNNVVVRISEAFLLVLGGVGNNEEVHISEAIDPLLQIPIPRPRPLIETRVDCHNRVDGEVHNVDNHISEVIALPPIRYPRPRTRFRWYRHDLVDGDNSEEEHISEAIHHSHSLHFVNGDNNEEEHK